MALSNKRSQHARLFGEAWAREIIKNFIDDPGMFPEGFSSLINFVPSGAAANLFTSCSWSVTGEEEKIAYQGCEDMIRLVLDFAKTVAKEKKCKTKINSSSSRKLRNLGN